MSSFDGYHRKHLPWLSKARAVGEVWQGPSGRWFTRRNDGKVVPAEDPHAGDPGETDGRPQDSPHALHHTDSRDNQPKDRRHRTEQTVSAAEQANADTVREMILLAKKQGVTLEHVQAISGVLLRLTTRSIQTLTDTATPGNEEMVNRIKQKLIGGKRQQPQNGVAPAPPPQQPQQPPPGKALEGYGPDARKVSDHVVNEEMPAFGDTAADAAYHRRAYRIGQPAAMTGEELGEYRYDVPARNSPTGNMDPPRRAFEERKWEPDPQPEKKSVQGQPAGRPNQEVFFDGVLDAVVQTAASSGDPTGHTAQPMQRRILAFVGFLQQRFAPAEGGPGEKGVKAVDPRSEAEMQAERNLEDASRNHLREVVRLSVNNAGDQARARERKAERDVTHMTDRLRESQRPPIKTMSAYTETSGGALVGAKPPRKRVSGIARKYLYGKGMGSAMNFHRRAANTVSSHGGQPPKGPTERDFDEIDAGRPHPREEEVDNLHGVSAGSEIARDIAEDAAVDRRGRVGKDDYYGG